jgi:hypothetical protein
MVGERAHEQGTASLQCTQYVTFSFRGVAITEV